jgi:hypothetical protein
MQTAPYANAEVGFIRLIATVMWTKSERILRFLAMTTVKNCES